MPPIEIRSTGFAIGRLKLGLVTNSYVVAGLFVMLVAIYVGNGLGIPRELACAMDGQVTTGIVTSGPTINHESLHFSYTVNGTAYEGVASGAAALGVKIPVYYSRRLPWLACVAGAAERLRDGVIGTLALPVIVALVLVWVENFG